MHPIVTSGRKRWRGSGQLRLALAALTACLCWSSLAASVAEAAPRPRLLVLRAEGNVLKDKARVKLTMSLLRSARRYKHFVSVASNVDLVEEMFAFECTEPGVDCLARIGKKYRADKVIYSEVVKDGAALTWAMRVVTVDAKKLSNSRVEQSTRQPLKSVSAAADPAARGLLVLIGPVDLPNREQQKPATLLVRLVGGGVALVYANEQLLGRTSVTGLRKTIAPGSYKIRVVRAGYDDWTKVVRVAAGQTLTTVVELKATPVAKGAKPGAPGTAKTPLVKKWWFWAAVGTVAVGAVAVYLLTRDDADAGKGTVGFSIDSADAHKDPVFVAP